MAPFSNAMLPVMYTNSEICEAGVLDAGPDQFALEIQVDRLGRRFPFAPHNQREPDGRRSLEALGEIDRRISKQRRGALDDRTAEVEFDVDPLRDQLKDVGRRHR